MPWKDDGVVNQRMRFVTRLEDGERMTDLCREFGISRKTGYKIWNRYREGGPERLLDLSRRPERLARRTAPQVEAAIVGLRKDHPTWGPRKLRAWLARREPGLKLPARSTIGEILKRHGLVEPRRRRRTTPRYSTRLRKATEANELWCVDFKGQFRTGDQHYCYPLTLTDRFSRYVLAVEALESTRSEGVYTVFDAVFREHGLPAAIRSDNGAPFASRGVAGLSRLSAWWIRLGIEHERIEPGHPEQNGQHERMHRTLKKETARPAQKNLLQQQERFDHFVEEFNYERPHEALDDRTPSEAFAPSGRPYTGALPPLRYPMHELSRNVQRDGHVQLSRTQRFFLGQALGGHPVGLRELDDGGWLVSFAQLHLGVFDPVQRQFEPLDDAETLASDLI